MTKEWWSRNIGGICFTGFSCLLLYAASAYITSTVTSQMKNYVPTSVWTQWAQERGEWRGGVDVKMDLIQKEQVRLRAELQQQLYTLDKKQDVQGSVLASKMDAQMVLLNELRDTMRSHMLKP